MASLWRRQASGRLRSSDLFDDRSGDNTATLANLFFEAPAGSGEEATGNSSQTISVSSSASGFARAIGSASRTLTVASAAAGYARAVGAAARTIGVPSQSAQGAARSVGNASHTIGVSSQAYGASYAPHTASKKGYLASPIRIGVGL
jgi:hypothetical protein